MTATILLIRHAAHGDLGQVLSGRTAGGSLSADGRAQASRLAAVLAGVPIAAVQSSPVLRARETAEAVAQHRGLQVEVGDALDEIEFGAWTGRRFDDLEGDAAWTHWNTNRAVARTPGGESMQEVQQRAWAHVENVARATSDGIVAMVSHCDVIRALVARVLGLSLDNLLRFEVPPASVSRLEVGEWGSRMLSLNERAA